MNNNIRLILRAKQILKDATPMPFDCGQLCGAFAARALQATGCFFSPMRNTYTLTTVILVL